MSYDTTVNDALDPPDARASARQRSALRFWKIAAALSLAVSLASATFVGWLLLRWM